MRMMIRVKRAPKSRHEDLGSMVVTKKKGSGDKFAAKMIELVEENVEVVVTELEVLGIGDVDDD